MDGLGPEEIEALAADGALIGDAPAAPPFPVAGIFWRRVAALAEAHLCTDGTHVGRHL